MHRFDVVLLTEDRYIFPEKPDTYSQNILLEDAILRAALEKRNLRVIRKSWSDDQFDWSSTRSILFRTPWDYFDHFDAFQQWLNTTSQCTEFINPLETVRWNLDKHYLADLQKKGIPVVETLFIEPGFTGSLKSILDTAGWDASILKPAVSGAAKNTFKLSGETISAHENIFQQLIRSESMLLQPFQKNILTEGEFTLMVMQGRYTHAVQKNAKPGDFRVQDDFGGTVRPWHPDASVIAFAEKIVATLSPLPVYARVDLIRDNNGIMAVSELELIEPELWLRTFPAAAEILGAAVSELIA